MKKLSLIVLGILVVLSLGAYFFVVRPLTSPPSEGTQIAERALTTRDVAVTARLNVRQATFLEKWLLGSPVVIPVQSTPEVKIPDRSLLDHLRASNVDARKDLDFVFYALYPSNGPDLRRAVMLVGRFDPDRILQYLALELKGTKSDASGHVTYQIESKDPSTCQPSTTWAVTVDRGWILIADPVTHAALLPRLAGSPGETAADLQWWQALAQADVLSLGIWNVGQLDHAVTNPFLKHVTEASATEAEAFQRLYLGLGVKPLPPQGVLRIVVDAKEASRGSEKIKAWQQAVNESKARWADTMPTVAALYDSLKIHTDGSRSTIELTVDRTLVSNVQRLVNELLSKLFSGMGIQQGESASQGQVGAPPTERIDTNPMVFQPSVLDSSLAPYNPQAMFAEEVDQTRGPFGLRIGSLRLGSDPVVGLEVRVEAFSNPIPNVTGNGEAARLFIDSVKSTTGQELLRVEDCGKERNTQPVAFKESGSRGLKTEKTVRLSPTADPKSLKSVSGRVELHLPTKTETVVIPRSASATVIQKHGATFVITKVDRGDVSYQIAGTKDNVLHFRVLNSRGQPLASKSGFSGGFLWGEGISGQQSYAGSVDRLEVVFAVETKTLQFPFTLTDFSLSEKPSAFLEERPPQFRPYSYQAMKQEHSLSGGAGPRPRSWKQLPPPAKPEPYQAAIRLEPFELYFDKAESFYALKLDFKLRSPDLPNFQKAFSVGEFRLSRIRLKDGSVIQQQAHAAVPDSPSLFRPSWTTGIHFNSEPKDGVLSTNFSLWIDSKAKPEQIKDLQGTLTVLFPKTLQTLRLDDLAVGQKAQLGDLMLTVTGKGRKSLTLHANKDGHKVLYVRLYDADGKAIRSFVPEITASPGGAWSFDLRPLSAYSRSEVILAAELERKEYPFVLPAK